MLVNANPGVTFSSTQMFFAALLCLLVKTQKKRPNNIHETSLQSYQTQIKILPFPGLGSGSEQPGPGATLLRCPKSNAELEITVSHQTLSDQILNMSGQFHILIGHDVRTFHRHNWLLPQNVLSISRLLPNGRFRRLSYDCRRQKFYSRSRSGRLDCGVFIPILSVRWLQSSDEIGQKHHPQNKLNERKTATLVLFCFYHQNYGPKNGNKVPHR